MRKGGFFSKWNWNAPSGLLLPGILFRIPFYYFRTEEKSNSSEGQQYIVHFKYAIKLDTNYNNVLLRYVLVMAGSGNLRVVIEKQ